MRITALHHVQLAMPEGGEESARAFYAGRLGLTEVDKPSALAGRGGCWFEGGDCRLHLGVATPFAPARKAHPALVVTPILRALAPPASSSLRSTADDLLERAA